MNDDADNTVMPPKYQVTARDEQLLHDLCDFRYATTAQLDRLHFQHVKLAQRRLRKLSAMGLVRHFRSTRTPGLADQRWFYAVAPAGLRLLRDRGIEGLGATSRVPSDIGYLAHHELLIDVHIWLREACAGTRFACRLIPAFHEVRRHGRSRRQTAITLHGPRGTTQYVPDAVFSLDRNDGRSALFLLEVDRGTEPLTRANGSSIAAKLNLFGACVDQGFSWYEQLFARTYRGARQLWLVPNDRRLAAILDHASKRELGTSVWGATHAVLARPGSLDAPIWVVTQRDGVHPLNA